jgi:hypothetical protein
VQSGTLKKGDIMIAGLEYGKVKQIVDDQGNILKEATTLFINFINCHNNGRFGAFCMFDRLNCLWHNTIICCHY